MRPNVERFNRIRIDVGKLECALAYSCSQEANMKCAIYGRVSTTDQGCEIQLTELREYSARDLLPFAAR